MALGSKGDDSGISNGEQKRRQKSTSGEYDGINGATCSPGGDCNQNNNNSFLDSSVYSEENNHQQKTFTSVLDDQPSPYSLNEIPPVKRPHSARKASQTPPMKTKLFSSTPASLQLHSGGGAEDAGDPVALKPHIPEGTYLGDALHKDGSLFSIIFQVCHNLSTGNLIYITL